MQKSATVIFGVSHLELDKYVLSSILNVSKYSLSSPKQARHWTMVALPARELSSFVASL